MRVTLVLVAFAALSEVALRVVLFSDIAFAARLGKTLRQPHLYAQKHADAYWLLQSRLSHANSRKPVPNFDTRVGWTGSSIVPGTYEHRDDDPNDMRRPVLLFGDSFAECVTPRGTRWQDLVERSDLGADYRLLNCGIGGAGFDQALLLFQSSIERFAARNPIVIVSVLVDNDLDRALLSFRGWPKPRFALLDMEDAGNAGNKSGLRLEGPVFDGSTRAYIDEHGIGIRSYAWNYLVNGTRLLPLSWRMHLRGNPQAGRATRQLGRRLLSAFERELSRRKLDAFVLLFHGRNYLQPDFENWRDRSLEIWTEQLKLPTYSSKTALRASAASTGRPVDDYFIPKGERGAGHYTPFGNEVVFELMHAGILAASR